MASLVPRIDNIEGSRNLMINGGIDFFQRSISVANRAAGDTNFCADRFRIFGGGSTTARFTLARDTDVPTPAQSGFSSLYSLSLACTVLSTVATGDYFTQRYVVEGYDYAAIAGGKSARLQFWTKAFAPGTYCISFQNAAGTRSFIKEYTVNTSNTWEKKTIDLVTDTGGVWNLDNSGGLVIHFTAYVGATFQTSAGSWTAGNFFGTSNQANLASSLSNNLKITQVSLVSGAFTSAQDYSFVRAGKNISEELMMCQRYFEKSYSYDVAPGTNTQVSMVNALDSAYAATQFYGISVPYRVEKRASPTVTFYTSGGTSGSWVAAGNNAGTKTMSAGGSGTTSLTAQMNGTGMTANAFSNIQGHWIAECEL